MIVFVLSASQKHFDSLKYSSRQTAFAYIWSQHVLRKIFMITMNVRRTILVASTQQITTQDVVLVREQTRDSTAASDINDRNARRKMYQVSNFHDTEPECGEENFQRGIQGIIWDRINKDKCSNSPPPRGIRSATYSSVKARL